jgi:hypothetical protein
MVEQAIPSDGLKQISLPVAQIRVICKNGPQVSIEDIKLQIINAIFYLQTPAQEYYYTRPSANV